MTDSQTITDNSDLRKYRTELPNIIDDLGLDPFERALYTHYKRVCGSSGGTCTQGTRTTAEQCKMSVGQVPSARDSLEAKGLIEKIKTGQYVHVKIVDIWELNFAYYSIKDRPGIDGWTIQQLNEFIESVHTVNTYGKVDNIARSNRSYSEQTVHTVNENGQKCSPGETKKEPIKDKNKPNKNKEESMPKFEPLTMALAHICKISLKIINRTTAKELADAQDAYSREGVTADQILDFEKWRKRFHWTKNGTPTLKQVRELWGQYEAWVSDGRPEPEPKTNGTGAYTNGHNPKPAAVIPASSEDQARLKRLAAAIASNDAGRTPPG